MSKKKLIIGAISLLVVVLGTIGFYWYRSKRTKSTSIPRTISPPNSYEEVKAEVTYEDASGFSIKHPESIATEDVTPDEEVYYALLNLTGPSSYGDQNIKITIKDTKFKSVDGWFDEDPDAPQNADLVGAASLDGIAANQYSYSLGGSDILLTVAIDQGVIYLIEGSKDEGFWEDVQNLIVSTFAFAGSTAQTSSDTGGSVIYEAEEVIE